MSAGRQADPKPIRLVFELARADNPRLFDELIRFPQGQKRVNRLRVLAYDGLLSQYGLFPITEAGVGSGRQEVGNGAGDVMNGLFEPALRE